MNWLKYLLGFSALLVAGCAAYFSVTGLGVLFSGASVAVMIMAGSLEFAKLVGATYLKQTWGTIKGLNKWYLTLSVGILMLITSAGIFGFLSNAFQQQNLKLQQVEREISVWENKIKSSEKQIESLTIQLSGLQNNQSKIIENGAINRSLLRSVDNRDKESSKLREKISILQDSVISYNNVVNKIKNDNIDIEREVGGFRFVAEAFGLDLNTVVKFFILLIVFVFDPLAIALIVAFNQILMSGKKKETEISSSDLFGEISRVRLNEDQLDKIENILSTKEPVERSTIENVQEEIVENNDPIIEVENEQEEVVDEKKK